MAIDIKKYSDIIWDWNGTLLNDVELCADTMNELLKMESLPEISVDHYRNIFTFPVEEYYRNAGHTFVKNSFEFLGKEFMNRYEAGKSVCKLFPSSVDLLNKFNLPGINQHILSAYEQKLLDEILKQFGIRNHFKHVVGLDNIYAGGKQKLAEQLIGMINSNGKKSKLLLIGDTLHDFEVASHLNADCVLIASGHQSKDRLKKCNAVIFDNLNEMMNSIIE